MSLSAQIILFIAYGLFLIGASLSFRTNGSRSAVVIMSAGYLLDLAVNLAPMTGLSWFQPATTVSNSIITTAIIFGIAGVWLPYPAALILRRINKLPAFHVLIAIIELCWFIDILLFMYGLYGIAPQG
ncbi:MAG: hypothetical protein GY868_21325 [Deltaproteobacteria bacterium]|nr:hypothetical protein [Deltaproteobacteria bacterium]